MSENTYGKKSIWKYVAIYAVIAVVVYGLVYFMFMKKGYANANSSGANNPQVQTQGSQY
jgi:flagellar basal body-associated protein FliL